MSRAQGLAGTRQGNPNGPGGALARMAGKKPAPYWKGCAINA